MPFYFAKFKTPNHLKNLEDIRKYIKADILDDLGGAIFNLYYPKNLNQERCTFVVIRTSKDEIEKFSNFVTGFEYCSEIEVNKYSPYQNPDYCGMGSIGIPPYSLAS